MDTTKSLDEQADEFLAENDDYFRSTKKKKSRTEEYSYLTPSQERQEKRRELPFSALSMKQKLMCEDSDCVLDGFLMKSVTGE